MPEQKGARDSSPPQQPQPLPNPVARPVPALSQSSQLPEKATISVKKDVRITNDEQAPKPAYTESEIKACSLEARARGEECEACQ